MAGNPVLYRFSGFECDPGRRSIRAIENDRPIVLTPKAFDTLLYLVQHRGQLVEKRALLEAVWPNVIVEESNLTQTISVLRRALADNPRTHEIIATVPGRGYQFVAPVETIEAQSMSREAHVVYSSEPAVSPPAARAPPILARASAHRTWLSYTLIALAIAMATLGAGRAILEYWSEDRIKVASALPNSIAVLPFDNHSPEPEDAYFASAIHEEILSSLATVDALNVIQGMTMVRYANTDKSLQEIARELNVEAVMRGSVLLSGDHVRMNMHLIDGYTGRQLWSDIYRRDLGDIFLVQSDIAKQVANALAAEFSTVEEENIAKPRTASTEAFVYYLQALATEDFETAERLLEQAIESDPKFALAHSALANLLASALSRDSFTRAPPVRQIDDVERRIRAHAAQALALEPDEPHAHTVLGMLELFSWRWEAARAHFDRAWQLDPYLAQWRAHLGDPVEGIRAARRSADLNPVDVRAYFNMGVGYAYIGDYANAAASLEASVALDSSTGLARVWLAGIEHARGNKERARELARAAEELMGPQTGPAILAGLAHVYSLVGEDERARRIVGEIEHLASYGDLGAGTLATAYLASNQYEKALLWLEVGVNKARRNEPDRGFIGLMNLKLNPFRNPVLDRPEFVEVRMRLVGE